MLLQVSLHARQLALRESEALRPTWDAVQALPLQLAEYDELLGRLARHAGELPGQGAGDGARDAACVGACVAAATPLGGLLVRFSLGQPSVRPAVQCHNEARAAVLC